jgi:hypothetical protein
MVVCWQNEWHNQPNQRLRYFASGKGVEPTILAYFVILMSRILCTLLYEIISTFHLDKYAF